MSSCCLTHTTRFHTASASHTYFKTRCPEPKPYASAWLPAAYLSPGLCQCSQPSLLHIWYGVGSIRDYCLLINKYYKRGMNLIETAHDSCPLRSTRLAPHSGAGNGSRPIQLPHQSDSPKDGLPPQSLFVGAVLRLHIRFSGVRSARDASLAEPQHVRAWRLRVAARDGRRGTRSPAAAQDALRHAS